MNKRRWDCTLRSDGFNNWTYHQLFWNSNFKKDLEENNENSCILREIERFTISPRFGRKKLFSKEKEHQYQYCGDIAISFQLLSDYVASKKDKKELMSAYRYGKCHIKSLELASEIKDSRILTGYVLMKNYQYLHSVVEIDNNIWDWTKNIIMSKDDYVFLTKFQELAAIESAKISQDKNIIDNLNLSFKTYILFRDEIMLALLKNESFFSKIKERKYVK